MNMKLARQQMDAFMQNLSKFDEHSVAINISNLVPIRYKLEAICSDSSTDSGCAKILIGCFTGEADLKSLIRRAVTTVENLIALRIMNSELGYTVNFKVPENDNNVISKVSSNLFEKLLSYEDKVSKLLDAELVKTESIVDFLNKAVNKNLMYVTSDLQLVSINKETLNYKDDKILIKDNLVFDLNTPNMVKKAEYFFSTSEDKYYYITNRSFIDNENYFKAMR